MGENKFKLSNQSGQDKLTFVNGEPAECGCTIKVNDGHGQYSDVVEVTLCPKHKSK